MKLYTTQYQIKNLKLEGSLQITVKGTVLGLHSDKPFETYVTVYSHPRWGNVPFQYFAVLGEGTLDENTVLYPMGDGDMRVLRPYRVDGETWFVVESQNLTVCKREHN